MFWSAFQDSGGRPAAETLHMVWKFSQVLDSWVQLAMVFPHKSNSLWKQYTNLFRSYFSDTTNSESMTTIEMIFDTNVVAAYGDAVVKINA